MHIRPANSEDLQSIQQLCSKLSAKEQADYDSTIDPEWPLSRDGHDYFAERVRSGFALVAEDDGALIGYCIGQLVTPLFYRNAHPTAELQTMFVEPALRSKGIGSMFLEKFFAWARAEGAEVFRVTVSMGNERGIEFYRRHGFKQVDTTMEINPHNTLL